MFLALVLVVALLLDTWWVCVMLPTDQLANTVSSGQQRPAAT
jgi:hypothetical protein